MKKLLTIILVCLLTTEIMTPAMAQTKVDATAAIMIDASTGQVIYEQNANKQLPVASISKLLTMLVIYDQLDQHIINYNTKVKITPAIAEISNNPLYSRVGLLQGKSYSVRELINAAMIKSADGATVALASSSGNSIPKFTTKMNQKARKIGLQNYYIVNPTGLTNGQMQRFKMADKANESENQMSARDVAIMTRYLIKQHPEILRVTSRSTANIPISPQRVSTVKNLNLMLPGGVYTVPEVKIDGLKTGTSEKAGASFVSTGLYRGHRIITVVLHANGDNPDNRFIQTQHLYQLLKNEYHLNVLILPQQMSHLKLQKSQHKSLVTSPKAITVWYQGNLLSYTLALNLKDQLLRNQALQPPIRRGERIGTVTFTSPKVKSVDGDQLNYPLYSKETARKVTFLQRIFQ